MSARIERARSHSSANVREFMFENEKAVTRTRQFRVLSGPPMSIYWPASDPGMDSQISCLTRQHQESTTYSRWHEACTPTEVSCGRISTDNNNKPAIGGPPLDGAQGVALTMIHCFHSSRVSRTRPRLAGTFLLCAAISAHLVQGAAAQDDEFDTIVVTGTRTTGNLSEIPSAISVIDLEEIEARNAIAITDLLNALPGVNVIQPSGQGGVARVFVRGGDQNLTMILVDGVRVNDPLDSRGSAFDFSTINLSDVERIEVVRGPHSAVYGSDALAGVINIITKNRVDEFGGSIVAEAGTDDYYRGALDIQGPVGASGGFSLRFATKDDGDPVPGTTFSGDSVSGRLSLGDSEQWRMKVFANYADSEGTAFPEDSGGSRLAVLRDVDTRSAEDLRFGLSGDARLADSWRLNFLATKYDHESEFFSPDGATSDLDRFDVAVNAVVEMTENITATMGLDFYDEDGISDGFVEFAPGFNVPAGFNFDRSVTGVFGEIHARTESGLSLLGSLRHDNPDNESGETTARLGAKYDFPSGRASVQANWGQGFALPGFFALASPLVGNPDLRPETSESFDIGVTFRTGVAR